MSNISKREIEKLKAIGYTAPFDSVAYDCYFQGEDILQHRDWEFEDMAWGACKAHSQSPMGMKDTLAAKLTLMNGCLTHRGSAVGDMDDEHNFYAVAGIWKATGPTVESAVDTLFWMCP